MDSFWSQLVGAIGGGIGVFVVWQLLIFFLPTLWPDSARRQRVNTKSWRELLKEDGSSVCKEFTSNFLLGSAEVEKKRRKVTGQGVDQRADSTVLHSEA